MHASRTWPLWRHTQHLHKRSASAQSTQPVYRKTSRQRKQRVVVSGHTRLHCKLLKCKWSTCARDQMENSTSASSRQCWHHMCTRKFAAAKAGKTLVHGATSHGTSVQGGVGCSNNVQFIVTTTTIMPVKTDMGVAGGHNAGTSGSFTHKAFDIHT